MDSDALILGIVFLGFFTMIFGLVYLRSRENMAMIDRGMNPKDVKPRPAPYNNLKYGLLLLGSGIGLALAYVITQHMLNTENPALWFAFIAIGGGAGLIVSYRIEKKEVLDKQ
ncbi:DUF6249 domain-containing protein [Flavihumibacter petaseus]|uniref:DUF6249 domain-containing protein n=1 Tax=Flavihumibacter petaseus NBRC 106054 TaxID=1220578 RepID=A0A0E9N0U0_9BACT|nr:DUF6249 domain-containing protein [Flavihumibacter petaseus]GAO43266.1 hypothetical protein FPE01S_02_03700 [Flavihumibacter petaseus NBRC 106054]